MVKYFMIMYKWILVLYMMYFAGVGAYNSTHFAFTSL